MTRDQELEPARLALRERAWRSAYVGLRAADERSALTGQDLEALAVCACLTGDEREGLEIWARAHHGYLDISDTRSAARCAFWLSLLLLLQGETARSSGWSARATRLIADREPGCLEHGMLMGVDAVRALWSGKIEESKDSAGRALAIAQQNDSADLLAMGRLILAECMLHHGQAREALPVLDEVMVSVLADEVSPMLAGIFYCAVLYECRAVFDLRRAGEWTDALTRWCAKQPDLVMFRGQCMIHRSEIMQAHGAWPEAATEAEEARKRLENPPQGALADAQYQIAEILRLRGDFAGAERAYRDASRNGRDPQPGLAQLRFAEGKLDVAATGIRRAVETEGSLSAKARALSPYVEIMIAVADIASARAGAQELARIAGMYGVPYLEASAARAEGAVLLAEGEPGAAIDALRRAQKIWSDADVPYEAAQARELAARACRMLGDEETAALEQEAALAAFRELGAQADVERLAGAAARETPGPSLTPRERDVLGLVVDGKTNKAIASTLVLSEKTVERHLSNIFVKLGVSSRAAATAAWFERHLGEHA